MARCWNCDHDDWGRYCVTCGVDKMAPHRVTTTVEILPAVALPASAQAAMLDLDRGDHLSSRLQAIGAGAVTRRADSIMSSTDEGMVWEDSPSATLLAGLALKYGLVLTALASFGAMLHSWTLPMLLTLLAAVHLGLRFAELRATRYRLSSQRLEVRSGLWNQTIVPFEVHQLGDAVIHAPLLLRVVGRATLSIRGSNIALYGIRNAEAVRDLIRNAGQIEAGRLDKIRWR